MSESVDRQSQTHGPIRDGGSYPVAPAGYSEALGEEAKYTAIRIDMLLFINARGTLRHTNQIGDIRQSPLRIFPPMFDFLVYTPEIPLNATRSFNFTVCVAYPKDQKTVTLRDARGSHRVEIRNVIPWPKGKADAPDAPDASDQGFGIGETIDEAVAAAVASVPSEPTPTPDALFMYKVSEFGRMIGGIAGLNVAYARVKRSVP